MFNTDHLPERISFGEFQLHLRTRELQKCDEIFDLQEQPFLVLMALLERPGQLVTREELIKKLWPADTFVDFEHSLNKAVKRLREALADPADEPRFIETLPRRGYRFIGTLTAVSDLVTDLPATQTTTELASQSPGASLPQTSRRHRAAWISALAFLLIASAVALWVSVRRGRNSHALNTDMPIRSLAVLPLENLSGDASQDYFADGMTDELITDLGQISALRVISRTSAMQYKGARKSLPQIARELNVDAVVEGTVLRSGDRVRITAQLIQAHSDQHLWAETYQGDLRDILALQSRVCSAIATQIRIKLSPQQQAALKNSRIINPEAYEAYLHGLSQKGSIDGLDQSIAYFDLALAKEPDYPEAHAWSGRTYMMLGHMVALPPQDAFPRAKIEALKALQLDESLAEAHYLLATVKFLYDWDFSEAEKEFRRAIALNPNSTLAHSGYSDFLNAIGRPDEAIAEQLRNQQIDPLSLTAIDELGWEQYWAGRYDAAIENAHRVLAIDPNHYSAHLTLGLSLEQKRQFPEALSELQRAVDLSNDKMWMAFVAHAKALAGDKAGARKILAELETLSRRTYISPWLFAIVYPDLGDKEQAFFWLEKCYRGREHDLVFSKVWPMFDSLRSDPRFQDLMRRVGLPE